MGRLENIINKMRRVITTGALIAISSVYWGGCGGSEQNFDHLKGCGYVSIDGEYLTRGSTILDNCNPGSELWKGLAVIEVFVLNDEKSEVALSINKYNVGSDEEPEPKYYFGFGKEPIAIGYDGFFNHTESVYDTSNDTSNESTIMGVIYPGFFDFCNDILAPAYISIFNTTNHQGTDSNKESCQVTDLLKGEQQYVPASRAW